MSFDLPTLRYPLNRFVVVQLFATLVTVFLLPTLSIGHISLEAGLDYFKTTDN